MKSIRFKIWISLFLMLAVFMLALSAFTYHSTKKEFLRYVNNETVKKLDFLAQALLSEYTPAQSFESLKTRPAKWRRLITRTFQPQLVSSHSDINTPRNKQKILGKPSRYQREFMQRLILTDVNKNLIAGRRAKNHKYSFLAIMFNDANIGFIGYTKPTRFIRANDQRFIQRQITVLSITSLILLVISVIAAFIVSQWLTKPIVKLRDSVQQLKEGDFSTQITPQSNDEIGALSLDINELARTLETNESSRKRWVADISHEMRTPVAVLKAQIEALQDGIRSPSTENLQLLHGKVNALGTLIDDLYTLSLSDAGVLNYAKTPISALSFYNEQIARFKDIALEKNIILHFSPCEIARNIYFNGDKKKLEQLFDNLIENAIRYTDSPGSICLECTQNTTSVIFHIRDSKPGVTHEQLSKIFDRLYRAESSRSKETGGVGLGLAICKNIVHAHNGQIDAHHSDLGGIHIEIRLPIVSI